MILFRRQKALTKGPGFVYEPQSFHQAIIVKSKTMAWRI